MLGSNRKSVPGIARYYQTCYVLHNAKHMGNIDAMNSFGETIRDLRVAQDLGLRETASKVGISPAYLSRIERGKERPPRPEIIKALAKVLAADPDVLFRLSSSTDPEVVDFLHEQHEVMELIRYIREAGLSAEAVAQLLDLAKSLPKGVDPEAKR